jgi:hypothetical protein
MVNHILSLKIELYTYNSHHITNMTQILPSELLNHILSFRPTHPTALLIRATHQEYLDNTEQRRSHFGLYNAHLHDRMSFPKYLLARWDEWSDL